MRTDDQMALCHLRCMPDQRLVHQQPCSPDDHGHSVFGESVFFRIWNTGSGAKMGQRIFRRLLKAGLLSQVATSGSAQSGHQNEYQLSPAAVAWFENEPDWRLCEDAYRATFKLPPRLSVISGGAA